MKLTSQSTRQKTSFANIGMENNSNPMEQKKMAISITIDLRRSYSEVLHRKKQEYQPSR